MSSGEQQETPAIEISGLYLSLDGQPVLQNVSLTVADCEFLGIIGPNGGGKTTLLKVITGLLKPDSGTVRIYGGQVDSRRNLIGYVPQFSKFDLEFPISVEEVVQTGCLSRGNPFSRPGPEDLAAADEAIRLVGLDGYEKRQAGRLSGGERQRMLIARALASRPRILLLDEPTASVDSRSGQQFYDLLTTLNESITIILVSHDIGVVSRYVGKIACLNRDLVYHDSKEITTEMLEQTYHCPVDLIAHGAPHRVLEDHGKK